jgi:hypothetical protein
MGEKMGDEPGAKSCAILVAVKGAGRDDGGTDCDER